MIKRGASFEEKRLANRNVYDREAVAPQSPGLTREARLPWDPNVEGSNPDGVASVYLTLTQRSRCATTLG